MAERPEPLPRCAQQRCHLPQPPPGRGRRLGTDPPGEPGLELRCGARPVAEVEHVRNQRVPVGGRQTGGREPVVAQPGAPHRRVDGLPERREVVDVHGVQGDPHQGGPHDPQLREGPVELGGVEVGHPVPQREVGRGRLLRLERDHPPHRLGDADLLPSHQQLPFEGGPVELPCGDRHVHGPLVVDPPPDAPGGGRRWSLAAGSDNPADAEPRGATDAMNGGHHSSANPLERHAEFTAAHRRRHPHAPITRRPTRASPPRTASRRGGCSTP